MAKVAQDFFGSTVLDTSVRQRSPLDIVMYAASLVSTPGSIDTIMEAVRRTTARLVGDQSLRAKDVNDLAKVYFKLEDYLVNDEPMRDYTHDEVRAKIMRKFQIGSDGVEAYWRKAALPGSAVITTKPIAPEVVEHAQGVRRFGHRIIGWSLLIGSASFFLPVEVIQGKPWCNNFDLAFSATTALLLFGGAWLFLKGLSGFQVQLKVAYRLLCAAMILLALAQSQQVIYTALGLWEISFIKHGGVGAGYVPSIVLFYVSMLLFVRIFKMKGFSSSLVAALTVSGTAAFISAVLPIPSQLPDEVLRRALPPSVFMDSLLIFATLMVISVKKVLSAAYASAMAWLLLAIATTAAVVLFYTWTQIFLSDIDVFWAYGGIPALSIIPSLLFIKSAMAFNDITDD